MSFIKKSHWYIAAILGIIGVLFGVCYVVLIDPVYFQIVTNDGPQLSSDMEQWIDSKKDIKGVHLYAKENSNPYELLLFDNRRSQRNLYLTSSVNVLLVSGALKINIIDEPAVDDSDVNYNLKAYFINKKKPKDIKVYVNKKEQVVGLETGELQITK